MTYSLGVDLGTTFTAAAVFRDGVAQIVQLGTRSAAVPSAVFLRDDGELLTGDAALRRGLVEPGRLAREFKRRVGDTTPILLGGVPMSPEHLMARSLRWTIDTVAAREGGPPDRVVVCHPANWGPYKLELLDQMVRIAGVPDAVRVSEPAAAAVHYASLARVDPGSFVAVYDLGGGTFDAAVLRKAASGFELLGSPEGIERLGGIDFDEAVIGHVRRACADAFAVLDLDDSSTVALLARLRQDCVEAKEGLSVDTEVSIPVVLPGLQTEVRLTRGELEAMVRVPLLETVAALRRALASAHVSPPMLSAVLLVGGSSRIPMVAEIVSAELQRPVAVDADPKHVVALGASRLGALTPDVGRVVATATTVSSAMGSETGPGPTAPALEPSPALPPPPAPTPARETAVVVADAPAGLVPPTVGAETGPGRGPAPEAGGRRRFPRGVAAGIAAVVLAGAGIAAVASGGGSGGGARGWISPCPPAGQPAVCITAVSRDGGKLSLEFAPHDVTLVAGADRADQLTSAFFLARVDESSAGSATSADIQAWGPTSPFTHSYTAAELDAATAVCVLVGDGTGRVAAGTGNCAELPSA